MDLNFGPTAPAPLFAMLTESPRLAPVIDRSSLPAPRRRSEKEPDVGKEKAAGRELAEVSKLPVEEAIGRRNQKERKEDERELEWNWGGGEVEYGLREGERWNMVR